MRTMIVDMESGAYIRRVAAAIRQLKGVAKVKVQKNNMERIPGLPSHDTYRLYTSRVYPS
jgi:cell division protein FtsX